MTRRRRTVLEAVVTIVFLVLLVTVILPWAGQAIADGIASQIR